MTSPVDAGFAPAGKKFKIIGAVNEVSPFPVANGRLWSANSPETTPCAASQRCPLADQRRPLAAIRVTSEIWCPKNSAPMHRFLCNEDGPIPSFLGETEVGTCMPVLPQYMEDSTS
jgi:hypothetical protein